MLFVMEYEIVSIGTLQPDGCRSAKLKRINESSLLNANLTTHQPDPDFISVTVMNTDLTKILTGMLVSNPLGKSLDNLTEGDLLNFEI